MFKIRPIRVNETNTNYLKVWWMLLLWGYTTIYGCWLNVTFGVKNLIFVYLNLLDI